MPENEGNEIREKRPRMRGEERKRLILERSKQAFADLGYQGASTSELAQRSEVTEPILYHHFGSKKNLFMAVIHEANGNFFRRWQKRIDQQAGEDMITALMTVILDYHQEISADPEAHKVLFMAISESSQDAEIALDVNKHRQRVFDTLHTLLQKAERIGYLDKDVDLHAATWGYLCMVLAMQYSLIIKRSEELNPTVLHEMSRLWLRGLLREDLRDLLSKKS